MYFKISKSISEIVLQMMAESRKRQKLIDWKPKTIPIYENATQEQLASYFAKLEKAEQVFQKVFVEELPETEPSPENKPMSFHSLKRLLEEYGEVSSEFVRKLSLKKDLFINRLRSQDVNMSNEFIHNIAIAIHLIEEQGNCEWNDILKDCMHFLIPLHVARLHFLNEMPADTLSLLKKSKVVCQSEAFQNFIKYQPTPWVPAHN